MKKKLQKLFNSWIGAVLYIAIGLFILFFMLRTPIIGLYLLVFAGVPVLFALNKQDWLPYIYGGVVFALAAHFALGLVLSTKFPLVAVVSGSMDHGFNDYGYPCGNNADGSFDRWWQACSQTYASFNITKQQFLSFPYHDGLKIGDMPVVQKSDAYKVGDIIVYDAGAAAPIIHRIVLVNADGGYQTKGDHNVAQNSYEHSVGKSQIEGKVIFVVPLIGYFKVFVSNIFGV